MSDATADDINMETHLVAEEEGSLPSASLPLAHQELDLHRLAQDWANGVRGGSVAEFVDYGSKGVPRAVLGDNNIRRTFEDEHQVVVQVSPGNDFFAHYSKDTDVLHFVVNGQPALVPPDWLQAYARGLRRTQGRLGHARKLSPPREAPAITAKDRVKFAFRSIKQAVFQPKVFPESTPADLMFDPDAVRHALTSGEQEQLKKALGTPG